MPLCRDHGTASRHSVKSCRDFPPFHDVSSVNVTEFFCSSRRAHRTFPRSKFYREENRYCGRSHLCTAVPKSVLTSFSLCRNEMCRTICAQTRCPRQRKRSQPPVVFQRRSTKLACVRSPPLNYLRGYRCFAMAKQLPPRTICQSKLDATSFDKEPFSFLVHMMLVSQRPRVTVQSRTEKAESITTSKRLTRSI